jgi:hypothetical protein
MTKLASVYKTDYVQSLDQHSQTNLNSSWVNAKGTPSYSCLARTYGPRTQSSPSTTTPTFTATRPNTISTLSS